jgi:hypothetical protein
MHTDELAAIESTEPFMLHNLYIRIWDEWNQYTTTVSGPRPNIMEVEMASSLKGIYLGKAAGSTKIVAEMFRDGSDL